MNKVNLQIKFRKQLPELLNKLNLINEGAEIGVQTGRFSKHILKKSRLSKLYSVDSWAKLDPSLYPDIVNRHQIIQNIYYYITVFKLYKYRKRNSIIRDLSENASLLFEPGSLDFVYIDAIHTYEGCKKDIKLWWPKIKKGGFFSGHDYLNGDLPQGKFGVKKAVDEFIRNNKLKLFITKDPWPSWYVIKK